MAGIHRCRTELWFEIFLMGVLLPVRLCSIQENFNNDTIKSSSIDKITSTTATPVTSRPPVELQDIGYDGTWDKFCDTREMDKDFPVYPEHELRSLRELICAMQANNKINRESLTAFAAYKYCEIKRSSADDFLEKLLVRFSKEDKKKEEEILAPGPLIDTTECFRQISKAFHTECIDEENPFFRMFKPILARACTVRWLTTNDILAHIEQVCTGKRIEGEIAWGPIFASIQFRDAR